MCHVVHVGPCVLPAQLCHLSATSETVQGCWQCRDCLLATWMKADKVKTTPMLWSLLSPISMDVVFDFPCICTGVKMDRWEGRSSNANAKTSCFHVRPAAVRNRRLKKSVWVCFWGFFSVLFVWVFFQHLKSDLQLLIKNELFSESRISLHRKRSSKLFI